MPREHWWLERAHYEHLFVLLFICLAESTHGFLESGSSNPRKRSVITSGTSCLKGTTSRRLCLGHQFSTPSGPPKEVTPGTHEWLHEKHRFRGGGRSVGLRGTQTGRKGSHSISDETSLILYFLLCTPHLSTFHISGG